MFPVGQELNHGTMVTMEMAAAITVIVGHQAQCPSDEADECHHPEQCEGLTNRAFYSYATRKDPGGIRKPDLTDFRCPGSHERHNVPYSMGQEHDGNDVSPHNLFSSPSSCFLTSPISASLPDLGGTTLPALTQTFSVCSVTQRHYEAITKVDLTLTSLSQV